jgi:hypothetical protein
MTQCEKDVAALFVSKGVERFFRFLLLLFSFAFKSISVRFDSSFKLPMDQVFARLPT